MNPKTLQVYLEQPADDMTFSLSQLNKRGGTGQLP